MILSVSVVLLLGVLIAFLVRYTKLRAWQAITCILFGFYLAATPLAQYIRDAGAALARMISGIQF